ncbi:MAG: carboxypeptidase-like regulatory domain-containing protein, partial [Ferruginibacter sp.]
MKKKLSHQIAIAIMKITVIPALLSMIVLCCYANDTGGQELLEKKITLKVEQQEIRKVFSEIEKVSEVKFVYSPELIGASRKVSINAKKKELGKVLISLLDPLNLQYELINNYLVLREKNKFTEVQELTTTPVDVELAIIKIMGKVISPDERPLEGANVVVKNSNIGTTTDRKGEFNVSVVDKQAVLVISFVGYLDQEMVVGSKTYFEVKMVPVTDQLSDVVVIGYGTQKRASVTGAIATVTGKDIKAVPVPAISNSLAGRLSGVIGINSSGEPGYDDASILIRGLSTIGNSSPLVVIDGVADRTGGFS